ncbi:MAG: hypothetical protein IJ923_01005 [Campylobacter sp.]|nr:hypothetical protein [Campylobacter sp.]
MFCIVYPFIFCILTFLWYNVINSVVDASNVVSGVALETQDNGCIVGATPTATEFSFCFDKFNYF